MKEEQSHTMKKILTLKSTILP